MPGPLKAKLTGGARLTGPPCSGPVALLECLLVEMREWWADDPAERYWIEITDRVDLGANLLAPTTDHSGNPTWSYSLVSHVRPGDLVLHWWKQGTHPKAVVAYSRAVAEAEDSDIEWVAHGTYGRGRQATTRPAWLVRLDDFTELDEPITLDQLRALEPTVRTVRDQLLAEHGDPLFFPFALSDKRPLRTTQGYLAKFPRALIDALPELSAALEMPVSPDSDPPSMSATRSGYQSDTERKMATERHAVDWTIDYLEVDGWQVADVGATRPFDLLALKDGRELHVEVKGSTGRAATVEMTAGEVDEADSHPDSLFVVVDEIGWSKGNDGTVRTTGGRPRLWWATALDEDRLQATRYRYLLPDDHEGP